MTGSPEGSTPPLSLPLPPRVAGLAVLTRNLDWSWSQDARQLLRSIDETLWHLTRHNPIELLKRVDPARLAALAADADFLKRYDQVMEQEAHRTSGQGTWFKHEHPELSGPAAYFCAEFAFHNSVPIYSGGLGILAGDHCKAASDLGVPLIGVGLLYTRGYFDQRVRLDGWQEDADEHFDASLTPLERLPTVVKLRMGGREVSVGVWRLMVGRVPIYLLDTDIEPNTPADRQLTHRLYVGEQHMRLSQEWILGVGGVRVLRALGINPAAWHSNEGHAAFMLLERLRELTADGVPLAEATRQIRANSIFTTHTPVPAGHDAFTSADVETNAGPIWEEMALDRETVFGLGHHPVHDHGLFHMAVLALRLSGRVNAVSRRHGEVSRGLWKDLWPDRDAAHVPISHVTNGVHLETWMAGKVSALLDDHMKHGWFDRSGDGSWDAVLTLNDAALWSTHLDLKNNLLSAIREAARRRWVEQWKGEGQHLVGSGILLEERALTIGFARRFATYKRADLLFHDLDRLHRLLVNPWRPVQLVFSGKAHPADEPGKRILQRVYNLTRDPRFEGRIAFIEDYEMHLAHRLVQGVDLWLNLPRVPLEASGTSGMKAALNGVPQLSTFDGWWSEAYNGRNGWVIPPAPEGGDSSVADAADADQLYRLLESEVVPLFYARDEQGIPRGWVDRMKHALQVAGQGFTARRMVREYVEGFYVPAMSEGFVDLDPVAAG
ncbi:MAG TPA: alpha-glucan family phosphorylase [Gemmatimonadales bacterium]|nr:alpha-glucan family phosphorylase [Gemmatimonadales bacterium]